VIVCFNAIGNYVPHLIVPGERFRDTGIHEFEEPIYGHTSRGWMDSEPCVSFLKHLNDYVVDTFQNQWCCWWTVILHTCCLMLHIFALPLHQNLMLTQMKTPGIWWRCHGYNEEITCPMCASDEGSPEEWIECKACPRKWHITCTGDAVCLKSQQTWWTTTHITVNTASNYNYVTVVVCASN